MVKSGVRREYVSAAGRQDVDKALRLVDNLLLRAIMQQVHREYALYACDIAEFLLNVDRIDFLEGDDRIDDAVVKAKAEAAMVMAKHSSIEYKMYAASAIMKSRILEPGAASMKYPD